MVSRKKKLTAAGAVLAVGFAAASLFHRRAGQPPGFPTGDSAAGAQFAVSPTPPRAPAAPGLVGHFSPLAQLPAESASLVHPADDPVSQPATIDDTAAETVTDDHVTSPASVGSAPTIDVANGDEHTGDAAAPTYRIHVVHNGDTLERLAERYLADGGRALELFDLNRDVLENPHLLPIGAELRIPGAESRR